MTQFLRSKAGIMILLIFFGLAGAFFTRFHITLLDGPIMATFDLYQHQVTPPEIPDKIAVILAGERSFRSVGSWPWPRRYHANIIGKLNLAKMIVIDMLFSEYSTPEDDALLAAVVEKSKKVVLAVQLAPGDDGVIRDVILPFPELAEGASDLGVVNVQPEADGIYRDYRVVWPLDSNTFPSIPLSIYMAARGAPEIKAEGDGYILNLANSSVKLGPDMTYKIHHPQKEIPIYEYIDVLNGDIDPETFKDSLIVVGVNASGAADYFSIGRSQLLPGSVYIAHAAQTLLHGWIPTPAPGWSMYLAGTILCILTGLLALTRNVKIEIGGLILLGGLWLALTYWLFTAQRLWLAPFPPLVPAVLVLAIATILKLRFLSDDWNVQKLSIDSLLFLGRQDFDPSRTSFADYLPGNWIEIEKWSKIKLITASAGIDNPDVALLLNELKEGPSHSGQNLEASVVTFKNGDRRLLLGLPDMEPEKKHFAILSWHGPLNTDTIRSVAAMVLSAAIYFKALEENQARRQLFLGVVKMIMGAVDAKDPTTAGHSERVATLSKELAQRIGLSENEVEEIYLGGLLHDVGKIGIPDHILNKPGRLTDEEMDIMRRHPTIGAGLMQEIKLPETVIKAIVEHHERLDGKGYPNKISGEKVSQAGRILKIADVYDALVSRRQYKDPMSLDVARKILLEGVGTDFDPELLSKFLSAPVNHPSTENQEINSDNIPETNKLN